MSNSWIRQFSLYFNFSDVPAVLVSEAPDFISVLCVYYIQFRKSVPLTTVTFTHSTRAGCSSCSTITVTITVVGAGGGNCNALTVSSSDVVWSDSESHQPAADQPLFPVSLTLTDAIHPLHKAAESNSHGNQVNSPDLRLRLCWVMADVRNHSGWIMTGWCQCKHMCNITPKQY